LFFIRRTRAAAISAALILAPTASVFAQEDTGLFLNIMPPGNNGYMDATEGLDFLGGGPLPENTDDQRPLYANLTYAAPGILDEDLTDYFKPAFIGPSGNPGDLPSPTRPGVSITRDDFGVPNIEARRRPDLMYGIGWASAADRLFSMDLARRAGRGQLSELAGYDPFVVSQDAGIYAFAGFDQADLDQQYADLIASTGPLGKRADKDIENFVQGINAFVTWVNQNPLSRAPVEYIGLDRLPIERFEKTDILAVAVFLEFLFGSGGGGEHRNALLLQKLQGSLGNTDGEALWRDLRSTEEPEAPVSSDLSFPYLIQGAIDPDAVAMVDVGSVVSHPTIEVIGALPANSQPAVDVRSLRRRAEHPSMSNYLAINAENTVDGHPILVGGPQAGYLVPELLYEFSVNGGGFKARGVAPVGTPYIVLGRGRNYAFSATAGGSDNSDVRAELLCEPDADPVTINSMHYMFNGTCTAMYERVDEWCAGGGQADPAFCDNNPDNLRATIHRTVHGIVFARATVEGQPVALVRQRASFGKEGLNAMAFQRINKNTPTARTFAKAISLAPGSFNWIYVNEEEVFYYHSGLFPIRADGVDYDMPSWGTGEWEWKGFLRSEDHPQELNPAKGWTTSWNNKPARMWRAADSNYSFGMSHRVDMLDKWLEEALDDGPLTPANVVEAMGNAGYTDLRGQEILPLALDLIGSEPGLESVLATLSEWQTSGAQRRDQDNSGDYDDSSAVAIMDAWFGHMIDATVGPQLSTFYGDIPLGFDDEPGAIGSAFQSGYYGLLEKTFLMALGAPVDDPYEVLKCADGTDTGCRAALVASLGDAVTDLTTTFGSSDPVDWTVDEAAEAIEFRPFGLAVVDPMPWVNRPTFQQVVQVFTKR
jgi:acyl-homoserine lactone acylase PvdQ